MLLAQDLWMHDLIHSQWQFFYVFYSSNILFHGFDIRSSSLHSSKFYHNFQQSNYTPIPWQWQYYFSLFPSLTTKSFFYFAKLVFQDRFPNHNLIWYLIVLFYNTTTVKLINQLFYWLFVCAQNCKNILKRSLEWIIWFHLLRKKVLYYKGPKTVFAVLYKMMHCKFYWMILESPLKGSISVIDD